MATAHAAGKYEMTPSRPRDLAPDDSGDSTDSSSTADAAEFRHVLLAPVRMMGPSRRSMYMYTVSRRNPSVSYFARKPSTPAFNLRPQRPLGSYYPNQSSSQSDGNVTRTFLARGYLGTGGSSKAPGTQGRILVLATLLPWPPGPVLSLHRA